MSPREMGSPSAEEMGFKILKRPDEEAFQRKMENYRFSREHSSTAYEETKMELENMAQGQGDPDVRKEYYPGWTEADFAEVLRRLEAEEAG